MQVYIGGLLQCGKWGHDRFRGWLQEPPEFTLLGQLVSTMYSTAAAQNSTLLKIRLQVSSHVEFNFFEVFRCEKKKYSTC